MGEMPSKLVCAGQPNPQRTKVRLRLRSNVRLAREHFPTPLSEAGPREESLDM